MILRWITYSGTSVFMDGIAKLDDYGERCYEEAQQLAGYYDGPDGTAVSHSGPAIWRQPVGDPVPDDTEVGVRVVPLDGIRENEVTVIQVPQLTWGRVWHVEYADGSPREMLHVPCASAFLMSDSGDTIERLY